MDSTTSGSLRVLRVRLAVLCSHPPLPYCPLFPRPVATNAPLCAHPLTLQIPVSQW